MRLFLLFFSIGILSADSFAELKELYASDGPFSAGKKLSKLKPGIHYLEAINSSQNELIIAVHGWKTN